MAKKKSIVDKLLGRNKPELEPKPELIHFEPEQEEPEVEEFMEIGGSPVPGITLQQVLHGHKDKINSMAWSPDGKYLASPSADKSICIWNLEQGKCISVLNGHEGKVYCVVWSSDGKILASVSSDHKIIVWDFESQKMLHQLEQKSAAFCLVWSASNKFLVSGGQDGVTIWDTADWNIINNVSGFTLAIAWSPDNENIAITQGIKGKITLMDNKFSTIIKEVERHQSFINEIAWSPNGKLLASASDDKSVRIWRTDSLENLVTLEGHTKEVSSVSWSADGRMLVSKSYDSTIKLWGTDTWAEIANIAEWSNGELPQIAFHPNSSTLASLVSGAKVAP
jgi:WD40 repeat protein